MLEYFLQHHCNIYSVVISTVWWEQIREEKLIYEWIKCTFYQKKKFALPETWLAQETDTSSYSLIIDWDNTAVDSWNIVEIIDWRWKNLWKFLVHSVSFYRTIDWKSDHLNLSLSKI